MIGLSLSDPGACALSRQPMGDRMNRRAAVFALVVLGAAARSRASLAQQPGKVWRVGFLSPTSASLNSQSTAAFQRGMRELGYVEGRNLVIE